MKICDLTQFYSPVSGGVKRYVHEKIAYIQGHTRDEHVLVVPGQETGVVRQERSRIYTIGSPLISRTSRYRALVRLYDVEEILTVEKPDIIESGDPYHLSWKAIATGCALRIPVTGFYHSHFPEAYVRSAAKYLGKAGSEYVMDICRRYVKTLYNKFERTFVPSQGLGEVLRSWGVRNVATVDLGVNTDVFRPQPGDQAATRAELGVPPNSVLLLYVGRLAAEKNTRTLFGAWKLLTRSRRRSFHLLIIGDGLQRALVREAQASDGNLTWLSYCADSERLARYYRAADLFVHPGLQETFGLVTIESQACGTPVIGIRGSYMDRIILRDQQHWATENTPESLAAAVEAMCATDLKEAGIEPARLAATQYAWPRVFDRMFAIYREICSSFPKD